MSLLDLAARAVAADGVAPFNEASLLAIRDAVKPRVLVLHTSDAGEITAAAFASGEAPVELVVDPVERRKGLGRSMVDELVAEGEASFWAHGDLPGAQALAASVGLVVQRTLLVLRLELAEPPPAEDVPDGVTLRTYRPDDADAIIEVNARAFAHHPEQGAMDRDDFDRRTSSDWFDPAGLFVAERGGRLIGFHWTKVENGGGEVYVVGIAPDAQGGGLGTALTARGIRHMYEQGLRIVDLYVEGDNGPALAVYRRLGFTEHAKDVLYVGG
ncbi:MAG: mshD [Aeromicrobium sp.]|nr:mshD [Aeromicrobium sp.]